MMRISFGMLALMGALWGSVALAQELPVRTPGTIPYKTDSTPIEEHGSRVGMAILLLLAAGGGAFYLIRKKIPPFITNTEEDRQLKIIKRAKLNPRTTLYVVEFNQRKLLISQSGDNVVCLADTNIAPEMQGKTDV